MKRKIAKILSSRNIKMGPNTIAQPLPVPGVNQVDPFLLIHHAGPETYPPGEEALHVDAHPHRGFDPVTFVFNGKVMHRDSLGNESVIGPGGVQWISAGKGIVHSEQSAPEFTETGGQFELIQLWINVPQSEKMADPEYQGFTREQVPRIIAEDEDVEVAVFAGTYHDHKGPVKTREDLMALTAEMKTGAQWSLGSENSHNLIIYQLGGESLINDSEVGAKQLVVFDKEGTEIHIKASSDTRLLILMGKPLKEPVFSYGPFVLNNREEVIDAIRDYESGKMGYLREN